MMRIINKNGEERLEPDNYILKDGETFRVAMKFMDGAPGNPRGFNDAQIKRYSDSYATYLTRLTTAWQRNDEPLPKQKQEQAPPSPASTVTQDAREVAYQKYVARVSNAWRG